MSICKEAAIKLNHRMQWVLITSARTRRNPKYLKIHNWPRSPLLMQRQIDDVVLWTTHLAVCPGQNSLTSYHLWTIRELRCIWAGQWQTLMVVHKITCIPLWLWKRGCNHHSCCAQEDTCWHHVLGCGEQIEQTESWPIPPKNTWEFGWPRQSRIHCSSRGKDIHRCSWVWKEVVGKVLAISTGPIGKIPEYPG